MAALNVADQEIYKDVRAFLLGLFPDANPKEIIQVNIGSQANNPLPHNAIVMQVLFNNNFDESVVTPLPPDEASIQNSVEVRFQLDFYGPHAQKRSRTVATLWKNYYACEKLTVCQPLYVQSYNRHVYINDSNLYEDRWILDLGLQYNPEITVAQDYADAPPVVITIPVSGA